MTYPTLLKTWGGRPHKYLAQLQQRLFPPRSSEYLKWQHTSLHKRLGFGLWAGLGCQLIASISPYFFTFHIDQVIESLSKFTDDAPAIAQRLKAVSVLGFWLTIGLLILCLLLRQTSWGRRYPALLFLLFACGVNSFSSQILGTFYGIPIEPSPTVFLALAVLIPMRWPLHLLSQMLSITYFAVVFPALGITHIGDIEVYDSIFIWSTFANLAWVCLICNVGILVYERLRLSELESKRELQYFLHAVSHDLRNPVTGTLLLLQNLPKTEAGICLEPPILERMAASQERQLRLINTLLEAHAQEVKGVLIAPQPLQLAQLVQDTALELEPIVQQAGGQLHNCIAPDLPLVRADPLHLRRVYDNIIANALQYNQQGVCITLDADVRGSYLYCAISDDGQGLVLPVESAPEQTLFNRYGRSLGKRQPINLGLGLHICRQIIEAHGGQIGANSELGQGSTFWFTLPLAG